MTLLSQHAAPLAIVSTGIVPVAAKAGVHASAAVQTRMYDHALATGFSRVTWFGGHPGAGGIIALAVIRFSRLSGTGAGAGG
jgi:hypothetical protein